MTSLATRDAATLDSLLAAEFTLSGLLKAAYLAYVKGVNSLRLMICDIGFSMLMGQTLARTHHEIMKPD